MYIKFLNIITQEIEFNYIHFYDIYMKNLLMIIIIIFLIYKIMNFIYLFQLLLIIEIFIIKKFLEYK